jgi:hypothetical protein
MRAHGTLRTERAIESYKKSGATPPAGIGNHIATTREQYSHSHPEPHGPPDRTPIRVGEVWENPVTRERATILERPWDNPAGRGTAELTALVGRV